MSEIMNKKQEDEKECQEEFEKLIRERSMGYDLDKDYKGNYVNVEVYLIYRGWESAWKNRAGEYGKGFNSGIHTVMTVLDNADPDDRAEQIRNSINDELSYE